MLGGAGAGWLGSSAGGLRPGHLVLLKLLQEMTMTMALSSRLTCVRVRWRAARDSAGRLLDGHSRGSGVKSVRRSGSGGQAAPLGAAARLLRRRAAT